MANVGVEEVITAGRANEGSSGRCIGRRNVLDETWPGNRQWELSSEEAEGQQRD
jgi:hypothetical protein